MMLLAAFLTVFLLQAQPPVALEKVAEGVVSVCVDTETDPALILACEKVSDKGFENGSDVRELFLKVPMTDAELDSLIRSQRPDGSWPDIDYSDANKGSWQPSLHAFRVVRMAIKYCREGREDALASALSAMDYWFDHTPDNPNWWHCEVGIPRLMGLAFVLLRHQMGAHRLHRAIDLMSAARLEQTGQNRVWLAGNVLLRAILQEDGELALKARNELLAELALTSGEGLQADYSFHQHGPQLQFGNYGLSFAVTMSWWARVLKGTGLDFPQEQMELLRSYMQKGLQPLCWKGWFDPNACSRHVFPNTQVGKALCVNYAARNLGMQGETVPMAFAFPYSDFGVYRTKNWYASIRMQSSRTIGFETTNDENMKGYFSSDGALLVRVEGDEYDNIWPYWDGHRIPGVTAWDDGYPIWGCRNGKGPKSSWPYNRSASVSTRTQDGYMVAAMDYVRDGLTARKAWFFFDKGIVCLGAGITMDGEAEVTTTVEQNLLKGPVRTGKRGVCHRGICYFLLEDADYSAGEVKRSGQWNWMSPALPETPVSAPLFEFVIRHGARPVDASYAYAVLPCPCLSKAHGILRLVKILSNTKERQSIAVNGSVLTVNWEPFSLTIN